jgi:hypothetical protein
MELLLNDDKDAVAIEPAMMFLIALRREFMMGCFDFHA